jgi:hypothetical protein
MKCNVCVKLLSLKLNKVYYIILTLVLCFFYYFVQWTNKCAINWQIIILLLHVLTLLCHLQGAHSTVLSYRSVSLQLLVIQFKILHMFFVAESLCLKSLYIKVVLVIIKWPKLFCHYNSYEVLRFCTYQASTTTASTYGLYIWPP